MIREIVICSSKAAKLQARTIALLHRFGLLIFNQSCHMLTMQQLKECTLRRLNWFQFGIQLYMNLKRDVQTKTKEVSYRSRNSPTPEESQKKLHVFPYGCTWWKLDNATWPAIVVMSLYWFYKKIICCDINLLGMLMIRQKYYVKIHQKKTKCSHGSQFMAKIFKN